MKNYKEFIIKRLGGYTKQEYSQAVMDASNNSYFAGTVSTYDTLKSFAENLYGKSAETWCKAVYNEIVNGYNKSKLTWSNVARRNSKSVCQ